MKGIRIREPAEIGSLPIDRETVYAASWFEEMSVVPVIHADGLAHPTLYRDGYIGSQGLWGCAICQQFHPLSVERCPLGNGPTETILMGPFVANEVGEFYVQAIQRKPAPPEVSR